jgi:hypothetical protein
MNSALESSVWGSNGVLLLVSPAPRFDRQHALNMCLVDFYETTPLIRSLFTLVVLVRPCYAFAVGSLSLEMALGVERSRWNEYLVHGGGKDEREPVCIQPHNDKLKNPLEFSQ